jgi:hypothetical protein
MQKRWLMFLSTFILSTPFVHADIMQTLNNVWWSVLRNVGNLGLLGMSDGGAVVALTRILIGLLVFTIIFGLLSAFGGSGGSTSDGDGALNFLSQSQSMTVAGIIAVISAIFLPAQVILAVGSGFGTIVGLLLIGIPVIGFLYLLLTTNTTVPSEQRAYLVIKCVACAILLWILNAMKFHVSGVLS